MATVEIIDVSMSETVSARLRGRYFEVTPVSGTASAGHSIEIAGWVLGRECPVIAVELSNARNVCRRVPVNNYRHDAAKIYPNVPEAAYSGFKINMTLLGLTPQIEFLVQAVLKDQSRVFLGVIRARRSWRGDAFDANPPLVSVVIPCYDQAHFLGEAIESVLAQTYPHFEVVVVDDGSNDNTAAVVNRYPGIRYIRQQNQGLAAARNTGLRHSIGDRLVFLDADDRLMSHALEVGRSSLKDHSECAFVYGHSRFMTFDGLQFHQQHRPQVQGDYYLALLRGCPIFAPGSVMYRREVFESVTGFEPSLSPAADYDLYYRIARQFPIYCHGEVVAEYRKHGTSMTRTGEMMLKYNLIALRRQWKYAKKSSAHRQAYNTGIKFWKESWGRYVVNQIRAAVAEGAWKRAIQGGWALLRFSPSYLVFVSGDKPVLQRIRDWTRRTTCKKRSARPHGDTSQDLVEKIHQVVNTCIPSHAKVIVVDKGDGGVLDLDTREQWHFPQPKEGLPERLLAAGSSKGSKDLPWINFESAYDFRLYEGKARRKLVAAMKLMQTENATLGAALEPIRVTDATRPGTILWTSRNGSDSEIYVSVSPRFSGYYPLDSPETIARLEALRERGAEFLLLPRTAFWWLEHYPEFKQHLGNRYRVIADAQATDNTCIIFDLRSPNTDKEKPATSI
jgi:glycosyltransferase involved in cell wall biosynthesis